MNESPIESVLRENIKILRKQLHWSQEYLAEKAEVSAPYITQIELGKRTPSLDIVQNIANAFGVEYKVLFEPTIDMQNLNSEKYNLSLLENRIIEAVTSTITEEFDKNFPTPHY